MGVKSIEQQINSFHPTTLLLIWWGKLAKMDELGFGNCTNTGACAAECPKQVSLANIARLNREFLCAKFQD